MSAEKVYGLYYGMSRTPFYIGRTSRPLGTRLAEHLADDANTKKTRYIQRRSWCVRIRLIERCNKRNVRNREQYWINRYHANLVNTVGMSQKSHKRVTIRFQMIRKVGHWMRTEMTLFGWGLLILAFFTLLRSF